MAEIVPGEGIHDWSDKVCQDSHVDFDICQEPNGEHECWHKAPHIDEDHTCACGFEWKEDHDPQAEWDTCVLEHGDHICWRRTWHVRPHACSCGFSWPRTAEDEW